MKINKIILISFILILSKLHLRGQNVITLETAIEMALNNNNQVRISKNNLQQARNSATIGNAGLLPSVNASVALTQSSMKDSRDGFDADPYSIGTGVQMDYTIFEGGGRKAKYELLKTQLNQAEIKQREAIESTILSVTIRYLSAAIALENKRSQEFSLSISRDRLKLMKAKNEFGNSNRLDVLNAQVDYNKDSISLINLNHKYISEKLHLIELISSEWRSDDFDIAIELGAYTAFNLENLINESLSTNVAILNRENQIVQGEHNLSLVKSASMPKLSLQSGYNYNSNYSPDFNTGQFSSSLNLSIPIFNGGQQRTRVKNAHLELSSQSYFLEQEKLSLEKNVRLLWQNYYNQLQNIKAEQSNLEAFETNFLFSEEMLKNGQITNTQFREAQQNLLQAKANISKAKYTAKQLEYELLKISGRLYNLK